MRKLLQISFIIIFSLYFIFACEMIDSPSPADEDVLDGPIPGLTIEQNARFVRGDEVFNDEIFTSETGLGPIFVANSCGSCHPGDGKGHPFMNLVRFGQVDERGNTYLENGGPQIQNRALPGFEPETLPKGAAFSSLTPPAVTGLGFLHYVSDETLMELADPDDEDGDGISGRPNWIEKPDYTQARQNSITKDGKYIGRFAKKASAYDLLHQTAVAYNQDIGITSIFEPIDVYTLQETDPELGTDKIRDVVFYLETLKAPIQRNQNDPQVKLGKQIFMASDCGSCHVPELKTGPAPIKELSNKTFYPYTDLLLHDMGEKLNDGYTEGSAEPAEWRTPPLWGLGLSKDSQGGSYHLLHDGRAKSIQEAILFHGGEAEESKQKFINLSDEDKEHLMKFLESL